MNPIEVDRRRLAAAAAPAAGLLAVSGLVLHLDFEVLRSVADGLAPDGQAASFDRDLHAELRRWARLAAAFAAAAGAGKLLESSGLGAGRCRLAVVTAGLCLFAAGLLSPLVNGGAIPISDRYEYVAMARTMACDGTLPNPRREPGTAVWLAAASGGAICTVAPGCIDDDDGCSPASGRMRRRIQAATMLVKIATVAAVFLAASWLGTGRLLSLGAGLLCLMLLTRDTGSVLAGFLLLLHAAGAAIWWRGPFPGRGSRLLAGVVSGLALGALVLTKAVFQYWLACFTLIVPIALWRAGAGKGKRGPTAAAAAMLAAAWCLPAPWIAVTAARTGQVSVSERRGEVLAIRAEFGRMTWAEVRGAFAYFLPDTGSARHPRHGHAVPGGAGAVRAWLMNRLEPELHGYDSRYRHNGYSAYTAAPEPHGYARFDMDNPDGFLYRAARSFRGDVHHRMDRIDPRWRGRAWRRMEEGAWMHRDVDETILERAALELMREDWLKHAVLTLAFLERGAAVWGDVPRRQVYAGPLHAVLRAAAVTLAYCFLPALGVVLVLAWRRRDPALACLGLPAAYVFAVHAAATHFLPRYGFPLVPLLSVVLAVAAASALRPPRRRARTRSGTIGTIGGRREGT